MVGEPRQERRSHGAEECVVIDLARHAPLVLVALAIGCNSPAPPWDQPTGGPLPYVTSKTPEAAQSPPIVASGQRLESGGIFVDCYREIRISGDAIKDVTRLGYVCGPVEGMRRAIDAPLEGVIAAGAAELELPLPLTRGACYRVFLAADEPSLDVDVAIVSSRGIPVATTTSVRGLAVIASDRPFCSLSTEDATIRVGARAGTGRFAVDVWATVATASD